MKIFSNKLNNIALLLKRMATASILSASLFSPYYSKADSDRESFTTNIDRDIELKWEWDEMYGVIININGSS